LYGTPFQHHTNPLFIFPGLHDIRGQSTAPRAAGHANGPGTSCPRNADLRSGCVHALHLALRVRDQALLLAPAGGALRGRLQQSGGLPRPPEHAGSGGGAGAARAPGQDIHALAAAGAQQQEIGKIVRGAGI